MDNTIKVVDSTLRDGEKRAGVVFTNPSKVRIAELLDDIGVHQIELGLTASGHDNSQAIKDICKLGLKASIIGWTRAKITEIEKLIACGVDAIGIAIPTSDIQIVQKLNTSRDRIIENMVKSVEFARKEGVYISVNAEDASQSDMDFLIHFANTARQAGANRLRFCDTIGILDPFTTYEKIKLLRENTELELEIHTHNNFGMATANALAGVKAGAAYVGVTVNGLGEGVGNAPLEEVIMSLLIIYGIDLGIKTEAFRDLSEFVAGAAGLEIPPWKAIVGTDIFNHESGIHADGALKNPSTYEIFKPDDVGLDRQIVIGKHSGTASIINRFAQFGNNISDAEAYEILKRVRNVAVDLKRSINDNELIGLYQDLLKEKEKHPN